MKTILLLVISILPIYLLGLYIYKHDREKESKKLLSKLFIFGIISCIPTIILELIIGSLFKSEQSSNLVLLFIEVFLSIALIEEICKWFMIYLIGYNHKEFDHIYDAIVYSVFVALGFAGIENILYVIEGGYIVGISRALIAVPGHVCYAIIMGNYLGIAKKYSLNNNHSQEKKYLIFSILIPTIIHCMYDYCLFTERIFFIIIFALIVICIYIYGVKKVKKISNITCNLIKENNNFCPICGHIINEENYCINCGNKL